MVIKMEALKNDNTSFFHRAIYEKPLTMPQAHYHDKNELYFLEKGKTKYFIGDEIFLLEAGDMVFVPAGTFHKTDSGNEKGTSRILFSFDDEFIGENYVEKLKENKFIKIPPEKLYKIKDIVNQIEQEEKNKQTAYKEMQQLLFLQMLIIALRDSAEKNTKPLNETESLVQEIAKYISENVGEDLSLLALSLKFALSPSHLSRLFKKVTGVGLNEFINISRVTASEKLLIGSNLSITQVATACGFNDSNYFAAVFKRLKGITPKKYSMKK